MDGLNFLFKKAHDDEVVILASTGRHENGEEIFTLTICGMSLTGTQEHISNKLTELMKMNRTKS